MPKSAAEYVSARQGSHEHRMALRRLLDHIKAREQQVKAELQRLRKLLPSTEDPHLNHILEVDYPQWIQDAATAPGITLD